LTLREVSRSIKRERIYARRSEKRLKKLYLNLNYSEKEFNKALGIRWKYKTRQLKASRVIC